MSGVADSHAVAPAVDVDRVFPRGAHYEIMARSVGADEYAARPCDPFGIVCECKLIRKVELRFKRATLKDGTDPCGIDLTRFCAATAREGVQTSLNGPLLMPEPPDDQRNDDGDGDQNQRSPIQQAHPLRLLGVEVVTCGYEAD